MPENRAPYRYVTNVTNVTIHIVSDGKRSQLLFRSNDTKTTFVTVLHIDDYPIFGTLVTFKKKHSKPLRL